MPSLSPKAKQQAYQVTERIRVVRRLVVEGMPEGEIVRALTIGIDTKNKLLGEGGIIRVSEATARRDLQAVAAEFRGLFSSEEAATLEIGAAFDRIRKIATGAASGPRPQYHAALAANRALIDLAARGCPAYRHLATGRAMEAPEGDEEDTDASLTAELAELRHLDTPALELKHRQLEARARALGIKAVDGGKG